MACLLPVRNPPCSSSLPFCQYHIGTAFSSTVQQQSIILLCIHVTRVRWFDFSAREVSFGLGLGQYRVSFKPVLFRSACRSAWLPCLPVCLWCICLQSPGRRIHGVGAVRGGSPVLGQAVRKGGPILCVGEREASTQKGILLEAGLQCSYDILRTTN